MSSGAYKSTPYNFSYTTVKMAHSTTHDIRVELQKLIGRMKILEDVQKNDQKTLRLLGERVVNLEPQKGININDYLGDGKQMPLTEEFFKCRDIDIVFSSVFDEKGNIIHHTGDSNSRPGFTRGWWNQSGESTKFIFCTGDNYNEDDVTLFRVLFYTFAINHHINALKVPDLYLTRSMRDYEDDERRKDHLACESAPSILVERIMQRSLGYQSLLLFAAHIAHGRKVFLVYNHDIDLHQFNSDTEVGPPFGT
jgi:hypothetical protein